MKKVSLACVVLFVIFCLCACKVQETTNHSAENSSNQSSFALRETANQSANNTSNQNSSAIQETAKQLEINSLDQYITYNLPNTLKSGKFNRELGYLGGHLFCLKDTGSCVAKKASDGTPPGWNSYGGVEMYYRLNYKFDKGKLIAVPLPWNHSAYLSEQQPVDKSAVQAIIVQVSFDLYTPQEAAKQHIGKDNQYSTMWYVFFAKENSDISYAIFLNADFFSKEDILLLAQSVKFKDDAFKIEVK